MASSSIGISQATKHSLAAAKPNHMEWDDFLVSLLEAADPDRFVRVVDAKQADGEQEAIERARERYMRHRSNPAAAISGTELRRRIHMRRLADSLARFQGTLMLATANPGQGDGPSLRQVLQDLDAQVHSAQELLQAA